MQALEARDLEANSRFPSGKWTGFFLQRLWRTRCIMNLEMTFHDGQLKATGADWVGPFTFAGNYDAADGSCRWTKQYIGKHRVLYEGKHDGRGIWGVWQIRLLGLCVDQGVFHLWPGEAEPTSDTERSERAFRERSRPLRGLVLLLVVCLVAAVLAAVGTSLLVRAFSFHP